MFSREAQPTAAPLSFLRALQTSTAKKLNRLFTALPMEKMYYGDCYAQKKEII